jgi:hypothetical protein
VAPAQKPGFLGKRRGDVAAETKNRAAISILMDIDHSIRGTRILAERQTTTPREKRVPSGRRKRFSDGAVSDGAATKNAADQPRFTARLR